MSYEIKYVNATQSSLADSVDTEQTFSSPDPLAANDLSIGQFYRVTAGGTIAQVDISPITLRLYFDSDISYVVAEGNFTTTPDGFKAWGLSVDIVARDSGGGYIVCNARGFGYSEGRSALAVEDRIVAYGGDIVGFPALYQTVVPIAVDTALTIRLTGQIGDFNGTTITLDEF